MLRRLLLLITLLALVALPVPTWAQEEKEESATPLSTSAQEEPSMGDRCCSFSRHR